jgi:tight adherence protein C
MTGTLLLGIALFAVAAAFTARAIALPRVRAMRQLQQIAAYGFADESIAAGGPAQPTPALAPWIGGLLVPRLGRGRVRALRRQLVNAGLHSTSVETYVGYYATAAVGLPLLVLLLLLMGHAQGGTAIVIVVVSAAMGVLFPHAVLSRRGRLRLELIDREMPELVDLLLVAVESGMGLIGAIRMAAARAVGPLGDELRLTLQQQSLGASTVEALENLGERCDTLAVRSFVRAITQGERLGVSIGQIMRALADDMRKHRKTVAEERANKTPVKILFPLVFMILPAMFIVLLMPAIYQIVQAMGDL